MSRVSEGHALRVHSCAFLPDGIFLASAGDDRTVRIWDAATKLVQRILTGHTDWVGGCVFDPSGSLLYTCRGDASLRHGYLARGAGDCLFK